MEKQILYLDRNENHYGPAPLCYEVLKNANVTNISWYTRAHESGKKSILSDRLAKDIGLTEDRIVLGYGAEDLLKQAIQCFLGQGDKLLVPSYSWWYYKKMADEVGGHNVQYPLIKGNKAFEYDINIMIDTYESEKPDMIFLSSPNNPTGNSIKHTDLIKFLEHTKKTRVVLDQAYYTDDINENVKELVEKYPNLLIIRTFSKYFALAGIRIGYAVLGKNYSAFSKFTNRYLGYHRLSEEIAIAALDSLDYYSDMAHKMNSDKEIYYKELSKIPGFRVFHSDANFVLVEIPENIKKDLDDSLKQKGILLKFMNEEHLSSHIRITLGTQEQNREVVKAIKEFFEK